jgi:hypothetical protein
VEERDAQLAWERRFARPVAAAALISLAFGVAAQVLSATTANPREGGERAALINLSEHADQAVAATVLQALSVCFLAAVLFYLLRCVRHRRPENVPAAVQPLILLAPVLVTVGGVVSELEVIDIADRFTASGARTEARADDLLGARSTVPVFIGFGGNIALGFCLVMVNLHCMRVGLMTRFLGIIGIVVGALYVLPIFAGPLILQVFWLGAVIAILIGRWPGGRGEAWTTGEPGLWLSAAEQRRQQMREERAAGATPEMLEQPEPEDVEARPHPVSKKRRRKRKR